MLPSTAGSAASVQSDTFCRRTSSEAVSVRGHELELATEVPLNPWTELGNAAATTVGWGRSPGSSSRTPSTCSEALTELFASWNSSTDGSSWGRMTLTRPVLYDAIPAGTFAVEGAAETVGNAIRRARTTAASAAPPRRDRILIVGEFHPERGVYPFPNSR